MADSRICTIDGCSKPLFCRDMCQMHYRRVQKWGDSSFVCFETSEYGSLLKYIKEVAVPYTGDECLIWPFRGNVNGYGVLNFGGRRHLAHRVVCELAHGKPPSKRHQAAHSCGKGHLGCTNPRHLRWATHQDNQKDRVAHGTSNRGSRQHTAKLDEASVREIRQLFGTMPQKDIARLYGVSPQTICCLKKGRYWSWLD